MYTAVPSSQADSAGRERDSMYIDSVYVYVYVCIYTYIYIYIIT